MIKNNIFEVYDRMEEKELETMAKAFEADYASVNTNESREFIIVRLAIVYALWKYKFK